MVAVTFDQSKAVYAKHWSSMSVKQDKLSAVDKIAKRIVANKARYEEVAAKTGVPWYFIGVLHYRESNLDFTKHLHNGDSLKKRTRRVPAGRPLKGEPPYTWEFSARDALDMKGLFKVKSWTVEQMLFQAERYNGFGYVGRKRHNSPYVWAYTNHQTRGKYVSDGKFDASHMDTQCGVAAILKRLGELDRSVSMHMEGWTKSVPDTIAQSKSLPMLIVGAVMTFFGWITDYGQQGMEWLLWAIGVLPAVTAQVSETMSSSETVASWFGANFGKMMGAVALACIVASFYRELQRKRKQP